MFKHWFAQGVLTNVASLVFIVVGGVVLGYLKITDSQWASALTSGLIGMALIALIVALVRGMLSMPAQRVVTSKNVRDIYQRVAGRSRRVSDEIFDR
jgi:hypothetical protein